MENITDYIKVSSTADEQKVNKLQAIREMGIDPYPHTYKRDNNSKKIKEEYDYL